MAFGRYSAESDRLQNTQIDLLFRGNGMFQIFRMLAAQLKTEELGVNQASLRSLIGVGF